jgi:antitoxin component YwqK of YwqJK toxin-antitoxin module
MEGLLIEDRSDSTWRYYYEEGTLKATGPEKDGVKTGFWQYFHPNGKLLGEGNYENGATTGIWKYYDEMGKLSATGVEVSGEKEGTWKLYYPSGAFKGEGTFTKGEGPYKEFYESGKLRAEGFIKDGKNHGSWKYYAEDDGSLEGIADFIAGEGEYIGYYKDGKVKMQGTLTDDKRTGVWTLYKPDGEVAGYYQAFYENNNFEFKPAEPPTRSNSSGRNPNLPYDKPTLRIKKQQSRYFKPAVNEFRTVILSTNPLALATGSFPVSLEYYFRERIGYELKYTVYRNPFFKANSSIDLNTLFRGGFSADLRQKFYQPDGRLGMLYFAHEVRFTYLDHQANILEYKNSIAVGRTLHAPETLYEYSVLAGNRWMYNPGQRGITFDIFGGLGIGYRNYRQKWKSSPDLDVIFEDVKKSKLTIPIRIGASIGYAF